MKYLLPFILFGCTTTEKIDMQSYRDWGTPNLIPIDRRAIPTEAQLCNNELWKASLHCTKYRKKSHK